MSIRPVDMQMLMPRVVESSRTSAAENTRPVAEQQQFSQQLQKNTETERNTVVHSGKTEGLSVNKDGKGNSEDQQQNKKRRRGGTTGQPAPVKEKTSLLDISL